MHLLPHDESSFLGQRNVLHEKRMRPRISQRFPWWCSWETCYRRHTSRSSLTWSSLRTRRSSIAVVCVIFSASTDKHLRKVSTHCNSCIRVSMTWEPGTSAISNLVLCRRYPLLAGQNDPKLEGPRVLPAAVGIARGIWTTLHQTLTGKMRCIMGERREILTD